MKVEEEKDVCKDGNKYEVISAYPNGKQAFVCIFITD
jgi:hypothetical protein